MLTQQLGWALLAIALCATGCTAKPGQGGDKLTQQDWAPAFYSEPIWSPDGARIAVNYRPFDSVSIDGSGIHHYSFLDSLAGFWMMNADGTNRHRALTEYLDDPDWSPDASWISFGKSGDIWKMKVSSDVIDTTSGLRLTFAGSFGGPSWNPSSTKIAFYRTTAGNSSLYWVSASGGAANPIPSPGWREPDWSPDGTHFVFVGTVGGAYGIAASDTLGNAGQVLRANLDAPESPKWSPDGHSVAFLARDPATQKTKLWVMDSNGGGLRVASDRAAGHGFSWAPDSKRIAFVTHDFTDHCADNGTLWVVDLVSGSSKQLAPREPPAP